MDAPTSMQPRSAERLRAAQACVIAGLVALAGGCAREPDHHAPAPPAIVAMTPDGSAPLPPSTPSQAELDEARRFRERFGLRADDAWIVAVAANPSSREGEVLFSVPLLPFEERELMARTQAHYDAAPIITDYAMTVPEDWYGFYIDQQRGGLIVARFYRNEERHRAALARLLSPAARWEVRTVDERTLAQEDFVVAVKADRAWFATIDAELLDVYANAIDGGIVELTYLSHSRTLDPIIRERYHDPTWLRVERAGGWPYTGPRGEAVIRAVNVRGDPVPGLICDLGGETVTTDGSGVCRFGYLAPGGYSLQIWAGAVGSQQMAFTEAFARPGTSTETTVVVR